MAFDFDREYVKGNTIPHVDTLSRLWFYKESKDKTRIWRYIFTLGRDRCFCLLIEWLWKLDMIQY